MLEEQKDVLKPISAKILQYLVKLDQPTTSDIIAHNTNLSQRQVDASITRALVMRGFAKREGVISPFGKREFRTVQATPRGRSYADANFHDQ